MAGLLDRDNVLGYLTLQQADPTLGIDRGTVKIIAQRRLGQAPVARPPAAVTGELTDRPLDPVALPHRLLKRLGLHLVTAALKMIVVPAHDDHPPAATSPGALRLQGTIITLTAPFEPVIHLPGCLIVQTTALRAGLRRYRSLPS